ncbi:hypothetical protein AAIH25_16830 [Arthrobacter crystallopoietes]|uniref:hypothetical protein n=1 Tax=Crystallibacter crystallopoietes TaxID=37928 RepID=UPI003D1D4FC4
MTILEHGQPLREMLKLSPDYRRWNTSTPQSQEKRGSVPVPAGVLDTYLNTAATSSKEGTVAMTAYPAIASAGSLARKLRSGLEMPRGPGRSSTTGPAGVEPSPSALPREAFCVPWRSEDGRSSTVGGELEGKCDV